MDRASRFRRQAVDGASLEALLGRVGAGARELVSVATKSLVAKFGDRGSCILVGDGARVVFSTEVPDLTELVLDLARYPEIDAAITSREVVVIEDVRESSCLRPVVGLLPSRLGAVAVVPLVAGDRCLGVLMAQSALPRGMSETDLVSARIEGRVAATLLDLQYGNGLDGGAGNPFAPARKATPAVSPAPTACRGRILVAEDEVDHAAALHGILTDEGFEVRVTSDGREAVREAQRMRPDLMLLDVCMPGADGFVVARELIADARTSGVPILLVSGTSDLVTRVRDLRVDNVDFLRKPYSLLELLARIEKSLNQAKAREHLRLEAKIDDLTGLGNPRLLRERLAIEQARIARYGTPSAIVMVDVDKLKEINDRHGHLVGSRILQAIGEALRSAVRETDLAARYGGDEFVVVLPHTTAAEGCAFAERVLRSIRELRPEGVEVSLSLGVAAVSAARSDSHSLDVLLAQADAAAYRAKRAGGSRVCVYDGAIDLAISATAGYPAAGLAGVKAS